MEMMKFKRKLSILPSKYKSDLVESYKNRLSVNWTHDKHKFDDATYQNLYFLANDEPMRIDDWYIDDTNTIRQAVTDDKDYWSRRKDYWKIVATTDKSLNLPEPNRSFIELFVEKYVLLPITEVMIEYEIEPGYEYLGPIIKIDKNNCITITRVKELWTRDEVIYEIKKFDRITSKQPMLDTDLYIEQNI